MIEYLLMAFFVAQPSAAGAPSSPAQARPPVVAPAQLRNPVEITAGRVTGTRNQATFSGDVVVKQRTLVLRCEKMVAHYDGPREVKRVECVGNVHAVDGDRTARGERAEYDVPAGVLVVTGNPEARQGSTYLSGTRVRMTVGSENVEVENARLLLETAPLQEKKKRRSGSAKRP